MPIFFMMFSFLLFRFQGCHVFRCGAGEAVLAFPFKNFVYSPESTCLRGRSRRRITCICSSLLFPSPGSSFRGGTEQDSPSLHFSHRFRKRFSTVFDTSPGASSSGSRTRRSRIPVSPKVLSALFQVLVLLFLSLFLLLFFKSHINCFSSPSLSPPQAAPFRGPQWGRRQLPGGPVGAQGPDGRGGGSSLDKTGAARASS